MYALDRAIATSPGGRMTEMLYIPYPDSKVATYVATPTSEGPWPGVVV